MLIFDTRLLRTANSDLDPQLRYAVHRWAELLDEETHFALSASPVVDSATALAELETTANAFLNRDGIRYDTVITAVRATHSVLTQDANLAAWYRQERADLLAELGKITGGLPSNAKPADKERWVRYRIRRVLGREVTGLAQVMRSGTGGYRDRLIDSLVARLTREPTSHEDWLHLDRDLSYLAAAMLSEGRTGEELALAAAREASAAKGTLEAATRFRGVLVRPKRRFEVALLLHGARSIRNSAGFNCRAVGDPPSWLRSGQSDANRRLRQFVQDAGTSERAVTLAVETEAWDAGHASTLAVSEVERFLDHLVSEHRLSDFTLDRRTAVLDIGSQYVTLTATQSRVVNVARTSPLGQFPVLHRPLRYHTLARSERVPVISVLHCWIAMEYMAADAITTLANGQVKPMSPNGFVPPHVAATMTLAAIRNQLTSSWYICSTLGRASDHQDSWMSIERWLGVRANSRQVNLDRWGGLLAFDPSSLPKGPDSISASSRAETVAAYLHETATKVAPFAGRRVREVSWRMSDGRRLGEWADLVDRRSQVAVTRMQRLRHQAVHRALAHTDTAQQLAQAGRHLLDAVFEIVPHWLAPDTPAWHGFRDARAWRDSLLHGWRAAGRGATIAANRIVHP